MLALAPSPSRDRLNGLSDSVTLLNRANLPFACVLAVAVRGDDVATQTNVMDQQRSGCEKEFRSRRRQLPAIDMLSGLQWQARR